MLLLADAGRSNVDALDEGCLQSDVELLQCLQHSDQRIDKCVVFDQRHILIHVCSDGTVGQQGNPVVQEVISGRAGVGVGPGRSETREKEERQGKAKRETVLELSLKLEKLAASHSPLSLPNKAYLPLGAAQP